MRWELLFADLEAQADAAERAAFEGDVADRGRAERAGLHLADRLRAHLGSVLALRLPGGERTVGRLVDLGADWLLLDDGAPVLVPLAAVCGVEGLSRRAAENGSALARRTGLTVVLRGLARDRGAVTVRLADGAALTGTIDRVGADHVDLALHAAGEARRATAVQGVCVIPVGAVVTVRSALS